MTTIFDRRMLKTEAATHHDDATIYRYGSFVSTSNYHEINSYYYYALGKWQRLLVKKVTCVARLST